ncbi:hypothetical protein EVB94_167 [Rhizobium phage RHph_TM40]|nr:hypothetical protein EVB94_167 [Rhizobium phage RHph_TM40]QIG77491.1 hypothetical protein EVB61_163 [Rhizobium phage RHph_TM21B]QIG77753.1 hypothetical protein EVB64_166 [Rhizobium phage RHph_TM61]
MQFEVNLNNYPVMRKAFQFIEVDNGAGIIPGVPLKNSYVVDLSDESSLEEMYGMQSFSDNGAGALMNAVEATLAQMSDDELLTFCTGGDHEVKMIAEKYEYGAIASEFLDAWFEGHFDETPRFTWHQVWYFTKVYPETVTPDEAYEAWVKENPDPNGMTTYNEEIWEGDESWVKSVCRLLRVELTDYIPPPKDEGDEPINTEKVNQ